MLLNGKLPLSFIKGHLAGPGKKVPSQAEQQMTIERKASKKARKIKEKKDTAAYKKETLELLRGIMSKL